MNITLPKWIAKLLFPKLEADLARRSKLTGTASRTFEYDRGPIRVSGVVEVEDDDRKSKKAAKPD